MNSSFSPASRALIVGAAVVVVIAGLKQAAPLIVPFLLSVFIAIISFPFMYKLQEKGVPKGLALLLVIATVLVVAIGLMALIGSSFTDFSAELPVYQQKVSVEWIALLQWLNNLGVPVLTTLDDMINPAAAVGFVSTILTSFGNVLTNFFLIILTVIFILIEAAGLTQKFTHLLDTQTTQNDTNGYQIFVEKLRNYTTIKTLLSLLTGVIISASLWVLGVDYALLWGVIAFMLNFIPNIGSIIAAVPAVLLTLVQFNIVMAMIVAAIYIVVNIVIGSVLEPKYMGKELGLSSIVVFISLVFWGWVLGSVGMLLSVPLTITAKIALDSKPETQWLGHLLGSIDD